MILGPVSLLDCLVFVIFLVPQLLIQIGLWTSLSVAISTLPFLFFRMPCQFLADQYRLHTKPSACSPFVRRASIFQDIVIRCVRYAFANIPASVGAVFFSKGVSLPFMTFRMLRHGYLTGCPISWKEVSLTDANKAARERDITAGDHDAAAEEDNVKGIWMIKDPSQKPDILVYYCHGGGFSMGSAYFYLEFLLAWLSLLIEAEDTTEDVVKGSTTDRKGGRSAAKDSRKRYRNPAILALEYTLVPDAVYPTQVRQTLAGYEYCIRHVQDGDASRICVAGDSAGATLILSLLLILTGKAGDAGSTSLSGTGLSSSAGTSRHQPGFATLISPWCTLVSDRNRDTPSDYLNAESLHLYARQYVGEAVGPPDARRSVQRHRRARHSVSDSVASPGDCLSRDMWARAAPRGGFHFLLGAEEVFAPETKSLVARLRHSGCHVRVACDEGGIHAWPVVSLFLGTDPGERLAGLREVVAGMGESMVF